MKEETLFNIYPILSWIMQKQVEQFCPVSYYLGIFGSIQLQWTGEGFSKRYSCLLPKDHCDRLQYPTPVILSRTYGWMASFRLFCSLLDLNFNMKGSPVDNPAVYSSEDLQPLLVLFQNLRQPVIKRTIQGQRLISSSSSSLLLLCMPFPLVVWFVQNFYLLPWCFALGL